MTRDRVVSALALLVWCLVFGFDVGIIVVTIHHWREDTREHEAFMARLDSIMGRR